MTEFFSYPLDYHPRDMRPLTRTLRLALLAAALVSCGLVGGSDPASSVPVLSGGDALQRGLAAHAAGRLDEAIRLYHEALARDPASKYALFNLGEIAHRQGKLVAAESWYRLALENDKNMPQSLYNLALVRQAVGDSTESASLLRRLLAIEPNNASAHWNLGLALRSLGQATEASAEFATAQRLDARLVPPTGTPAPTPTR